MNENPSDVPDDIPEDDEAPEDDALSKKYKPTDDELGDMLIADWNGRFSNFFGVWQEYADGVWIPAEGFKRNIWDKLKELKSFGVRPTNSKVSSVEAYLTEYLTIGEKLIDTDLRYINLKNGAYNLETGQLEEHKRDLYMTSQLSFAYDPEAECLVFEKFLRDSLVTPDGKTDYRLIEVVQEAIGYSLTASTDYRASFWLLGESGTGKSVLVGVLTALAGNSHVTIDLDQMMSNPYQIADIAGKRLVTFTEPKANGVLADNHYKRLVSQDRIMARQIFGKPFSFVPMCKVWGAMNETPRVIDRSDAIFNRVMILPMNRVVPENKRDGALAVKLESELAGIFNWALRGLKRLKLAGKFTHCEQVEAARAEYKSENDTEAAFVADWCVTAADKNIGSQRLYDAYRQWCQRNGAMAKSSTKVARDWKRLGFAKRHTMYGNVYDGLTLNPSIEGTIA